MRRTWTWLVELSLFVCLAACGPDESATPSGAEVDGGATDAPDAFQQDDAPADAAPVPEGFARVEPGSFRMGSALDEPGRVSETETPHDVVLSRPLLVKTTEVTQAEWQALMDGNPSYFSDCGEDCPVENVNWWEAIAWCNALSEQEGLPPCYELTGCQGQVGLDHVCEGVTVNTQDGSPVLCEGYRLPTEAEWEYVARAGTTTAFPAGGFDDIASAGVDCSEVAALDASGWYCANSGDTPHPVAGKQANAWGLYDTAGNVLEWVGDRYAPYSAASTVTDPTGDTTGALRVLRGGSWSRAARVCRSAAREALDPAERDGDTGFRPVRTILSLPQKME